MASSTTDARRDEPRSPLKQKALRYPGQSLDDRIDTLINDDASMWILVPLLVWLIAGFEWYGKISAAPRRPGIYAALAAIATAVSVWRLVRIKRQLRAYKLGRDGERVIGQYLEELRAEGARIFHDVQADGFNIDHVVITRSGVFAIETKTWTKKSGKSQISSRDGAVYKNRALLDPNPLDQAIGAAKWLSEILSKSTGKNIPVWPVVLFPGWWVEPMDEATKRRGWVLNEKALPGFLSHAEKRLQDSDVSMIDFHLAQFVRSR